MPSHQSLKRAKSSYSDIPKKRRQRIHAQIGETLEKHSRAPKSTVINELAHHFSHAQKFDPSLSDKTIIYLYQAGRFAAKQFANADAMSYYNRALALTPEDDPTNQYQLLIARERLFDVQGNRESQKYDLKKLWSLAKDMKTEQQAEVMLRHAKYANEISDYNESLKAAELAVSLAESDQLLLISEGNLMAGRALFRQSKCDLAKTKINQGLDLARKAKAPWLEAYCLISLGLSHYYLGELIDACKCMEEAKIIFRQISDLRGLSATLNNLGSISNLQGDNLAAQSYYMDALEIHKKMGSRMGEGMILNNLGVISAAQGDYTQALQNQKQALIIAREIQNQLYEGNALLNLGNVYLSLGAYEEARESYRFALDVYKQIGNQSGEGWGLAYSSLLAHRFGNQKAALRYAQEALQITEEIGDRHIQGYVWAHLGHAQLALENHADAFSAYQKSVSLRRDLDEMHLVMESLSGVLRVYLCQNGLAKAIPHLDEIFGFLEHKSLEGTDEPVRIYLTCIQVLRTCNDTRMKPLLNKAHSLLQEQASNIDDDKLRGFFLENIPAHKELITLFVKNKVKE